MPLVFPGNEGATDQFEKLLEAFDGTKRVVVVTSEEAIEDFGLAAVQAKASAKYDHNQFDDRRVTVFTTDFR